MNLKLPFFILLAQLCISTSSAQQTFIEDFTLRGDTYLTDADCFRLTEAVDYRSGSIWYKHPISLQEPFAVELSIMLGCDDDGGADGMVFIFSPYTNRLGYVGEGIGFGGLRPSVGIEIDTWRNYHLDDPDEDHLAFLLNGRIGHFSEGSTPFLVKNLEDCTQHSFVVSWTPGNQRLSIYLDGDRVATTKLDLINTIFRGNDAVYWGMTAATGRYNNIHEVCFDRISQHSPRIPFPWNERNTPWWKDIGDE